MWLRAVPWVREWDNCLRTTVQEQRRGRAAQRALDRRLTESKERNRVGQWKEKYREKLLLREIRLVFGADGGGGWGRRKRGREEKEKR